MNRKALRLLGIFCTVFCTSASVFAEIRMSAIFGNKMVLQRETQVAIWGTANIY